MLSSALEQARQQTILLDEAVKAARRKRVTGSRSVARTVGDYQARLIAVALSAVSDMLAEQDIPDDQLGEVRPDSLNTGLGAAHMIDQTSTDAEFERLIRTLVSDAGRTAQSVDIATRRAVTGYVRNVSAPCCSRCAILAGRIYRWSTGFKRHPRCDCFMVPTKIASASALTTSPDDLFRKGQITDLTRAQTKALNQGADIGRVINVNRRKAGLTVGGSVIERGGRLTPAGIFRISSDRAEALMLLRRFGYVI